ncbi:HugZ family protein [Rosistilla oblonga]|uniref:HugZ family pyridoxamine 5'-phosphate oxidase n=1 Tax=Rosistilla oblonga TaxID=2527990 RepID=UPI003A984E27
MAQPRKHAYTTASEDPNPAAETTFAERARTMLSLSQVGVISTHSVHCKGFPFGSTMPYALDAIGRPLFLISAMAMHTKNLREDPRASLFVTDPSADRDPLGAGRLTLVGSAEPVPDEELDETRALYLSRHENASYYVDFADFSFWRLNPTELYFVGGFGVMGWIQADDFQHAVADPLAESAAGILQHMNDDHAAAMLDIAYAEKEIVASEAKMTAVDRLGFHLRLKTPERVQSVRIGFPHEVRSSDECRQVLVAMVKQARSDKESKNEN